MRQHCVHAVLKSLVFPDCWSDMAPSQKRVGPSVSQVRESAGILYDRGQPLAIQRGGKGANNHNPLQKHYLVLLAVHRLKDDRDPRKRYIEKVFGGTAIGRLNGALSHVQCPVKRGD